MLVNVQFLRFAAAMLVVFYHASKQIRATGIDQGQLSKLMSGEAGLSIASLERLAEFLNLEIIVRPKRRKRSK